MPTTRRRTGLARSATGLTLALALALTGCSADEPEPSPEPPGNGNRSAATEEAEAPESTLTITVGDDSFSPAETTVKVGDTVKWEWSSGRAHNVQGIGDMAMGINSPILNSGEWSYTFTTPGEYRYMCTLHPEMRGKVIVTE